MSHYIVCTLNTKYSYIQVCEQVCPHTFGHLLNSAGFSPFFFFVPLSIQFNSIVCLCLFLVCPYVCGSGRSFNNISLSNIHTVHTIIELTTPFCRPMCVCCLCVHKCVLALFTQKALKENEKESEADFSFSLLFPSFSPSSPPQPCHTPHDLFSSKTLLNYSMRSG